MANTTIPVRLVGMLLEPSSHGFDTVNHPAIYLQTDVAFAEAATWSFSRPIRGPREIWI